MGVAPVAQPLGQAQALAVPFARVKQALGEADFAALAWSFWRAHPPERGDLAQWGGALAGFLAGAITSGCLMAVFLANSGGSWDNAKKLVEDGAHGGKGSAAHAATVIGDTVGDPFKDTAGPAINPLIKVMNLVSVLVAPAIVALTIGSGANAGLRFGIALIALAVVVAAVVVSKRRDLAIAGDASPAAERVAS